MIISKVRMVNFRGFRDKTICFSNKAVVLLSASNGIGKTTTIDAIEWCFTGNIGRLKKAFDLRSSNDDERKLNTEGILKNRDADKNDLIKVSLWLIDGNKEIKLCREQEKDKLDPNLSKVYLNDSESGAVDYINAFVGESFYNYHFCDVQKSFNIQRAKRGELESLFCDFITDYSDKLHVAENLSIFAEDVSRYIEDNEKLMTDSNIINEHETRLKNEKEKINQIKYPEVIFFEGERTDITELTKDELLKQKEYVEKCGFSVAENSLGLLCENERLKDKIEIINKIDIFRADNKNELRQAKRYGLFKLDDAVKLLEDEVMKYKALSLNKDTIFSECLSIDLLNKNDLFIQEYNKNKRRILEKKQELNDLSSEIDLLSSNNKILKLLANLSAKKQLIIGYRNEVRRKNDVVKCPICGSDNFSTMDATLILKEADDYIRQNGEYVKKKEIEKSLLQEEIEKLYQNIILAAKGIINNELGLLEGKINDLKVISVKLQPYFNLLDQLKMVDEKEKFIESDDISLDALLDSIKTKLLTRTKEEELTELYQKTLTVLGYNYSSETIFQTHEKVKGLVDIKNKVVNYSYDTFLRKINAIDSILLKQEIFELNKMINDEKKKNDEISKVNEKLKKLYEKATGRAGEIREIVNLLSKSEYDNVGPTLNKFYNKLIRLDNGEGINTVHKNGGISLVDNKGKNIVNVLSNGQICVFMLAYFFAGINVRNAKEKMKIFFVDDLTACMDDVNMLAFMDMLKYQIDANETIEQLFFITCDNRISDLLKYKLKGREIDMCELREDDFI